MLTFNTTIDTMLNVGRLVRYEPRFRFDQQPTCLVYLRPECHKQIKALPDAPVGENPDPVPREQITVLLDRFCAGNALLVGHDFDPRGEKLFVLKTRSVRAGTVFLSQGVLIMLDVQPKAAFNRDKGGKLNNTKWYASCRALPEFQQLSPFAVKDAP